MSSFEAPTLTGSSFISEWHVMLDSSVISLRSPFPLFLSQRVGSKNSKSVRIMNYRLTYTYVSVERTAGNAYLCPLRRARGSASRTERRREIERKLWGGDRLERREEKRPSEQQVASSFEGVKEPLSSCLFSSVVLVLGRWDRENGYEERDGIDPHIHAHVYVRTYIHTYNTYIFIYIYTRVCVCEYTCMYVHIYIVGVRHPINLLLANRLANCERMLARANKGASIY